MKLSPYLKLSRHNIYNYRRRIPGDLIPLFGIDEVRKSLNTGEYWRAKALSRIITPAIDILFLKVRTGMEPDPQDKLNKLMLLVASKKAELDTTEKYEALLGPLQEENLALIRKLKKIQQSGASTDELLEKIKAALNPPSTKPLTIKEAIDKFAEPLQIRNRKDRPATVRKNLDSLNAFAEIVGPLREVSTLTQVDAALFVSEIPFHKRRGKAPRAANTINGFISSVQKFIKWVRAFHSEAGMPELEWSVLRPKKELKAHEERELITDEEFQAVQNYHKFLNAKTSDPAVFWLINIAAYGGLRLEEICQLNPKHDVVTFDGIWCFLVTDLEINGTGKATKSDFKNIKTTNANRKVPIHSKLIEWGLLEYVEELKRTGAINMVPGEAIYQGRSGKNIGRRVNRLLKRAIGTEGKTLHSFRHSISTKLKQALVEETLTAGILGHAEQGVTYGRYGKAHLIPLLKEKIEIISYNNPLRLSN